MGAKKETATQPVRALRADDTDFEGYFVRLGRRRHSGYEVGGTSPFGTRRAMPVYCKKSIAALPRIYINGGKRGYIIARRIADALALLTGRNRSSRDSPAG